MFPPTIVAQEDTSEHGNPTGAAPAQPPAQPPAQLDLDAIMQVRRESLISLCSFFSLSPPSCSLDLSPSSCSLTLLYPPIFLYTHFYVYTLNSCFLFPNTVAVPSFKALEVVFYCWWEGLLLLRNQRG